MSWIRRAFLIALGTCMIGMLFAWLILRNYEPLSMWASSSSLLGWTFQGAAWLSCLGGAWLIAFAVTHKRSAAMERTPGTLEGTD